jgi:hypothetical protein
MTHPLAAICALISIISGPDQGCSVIDSWFGPADVRSLTGNGALTVGVNPCGRVSLCRWPGPGYSNRVSFRTRSVDLPMLGVDPWHGLMWGLSFQDKTWWISGDPWKTVQRYLGDNSTAIETVATLSDPPVTATQTLFVHPARDLLVARLTLRGFHGPPLLFWFANFSPGTRLIPEWPVGDWAFDWRNDFAVFTPDSGTTICHFRPRNSGAREWAEAERLAAGRASIAEWSLFGEGVWISYTTPNRIAGFQCGTDPDASSAFRQAEAGQLTGQTAAVGQCNSALAILPDADADGYAATVLVAFGRDWADTQQTLTYAADRTYAALLEETHAHWGRWLAPAFLPNSDDPRLSAACKRDLLVLAQCMDRNTGAIVRSPVAHPPLALDWPRHGAWIMLALDMAGYHDLAETHTLFYCDAVRKEARRGKPLGSLPAALYPDRTEAVPHLVMEADSVAWMLGAFWRHATLLDVAKRRHYLDAIWDATRLAADFLVNWTDGRNREPQFSFDPRLCRDAQSPDLLLTTYMGVDSALRIAEASGKNSPDAWAQRKRDLEALIRFHCVDTNAQWTSDAMLSYWHEEFGETKLPAWDAPLERRLAAAKQESAADRTETVCDAALIWHGKPDKLQPIAPLLDPDPGSRFPDALEAARHFIAASLLYARPR